MRTNTKEAKGAAEVLINVLGFLSFLFGSLMLLSIVFGMIGHMSMSTKPLQSHYFRLNELKETMKGET